MTQDPTNTPGKLPWHLAAMAGVWLVLALWTTLAGRLGCAAALPLVLVLWVLIFLAGCETALLRRHLFIRACLRPHGRLARWLGRRLFLYSWQGVKSLALALILVVALLLLNPSQWLFLLFDILVLGALLWLLNRLLRDEVIVQYQAALARTWARRINAIFVWLGLLVSLLFTARDDYYGVGFSEALRHGAARVELGCDALAILARTGALLETASWWTAQRLFAGLEGMPVTLAWLGFIAAFGLSFLLAWAYSGVLGGVMARPWRFTSQDGNP
ncbi:MAG: hypothetical protein LC646_11920 [Xanthomonadaceae bacterium]|nr:hypothetical protein [Xanthomonadaceae bacterium]